MHHFPYRDGGLHAEDVDLRRLADTFGTPFYCYSTATLSGITASSPRPSPARTRSSATPSRRTRTRPCWRRLPVSAPAWTSSRKASCGARLRAEVPAERIVFSGVGKTQDEMAAGLDAGILCFNVECEPEMEALAEVATAKGRVAPISMRVNPDVDARTHPKISTGKSENKFGIPISRAREVYARAARLPALKVAGVDMHIGSQITELAPFDNATQLLAELARDLMAEGHALRHIDLGGGLGIPYRERRSAAARPARLRRSRSSATRRASASSSSSRSGRMIAGNAGILVTRVIYVKQGEGKTFVIVDAGMNDLIRPTLYEAQHEIKPVQSPRRARRDRRRRRRAGLRDRRLPRARPRPAGAEGGRSSRRHDGRRLWGRPGRHLQHAAARAGGSGARRRRRARAAAPDLDELIGLDRVPDWLA